MNKNGLTALEVAEEYYTEEYAHFIEVNALDRNEESAERFITEVEQELNESERWDF